MVAQPQLILSAAPAACWDQFQRELALRVWEANLDSESVLWLISRTGGVPPRVTVESTARPGDRIECSFDAEVGTITCAPGPAVHAPVRQFRWGGERFHCDGREYSVAAAAADILDELVCIDDE